MPTAFLAYPATLNRQKDGRYLVRFPDLPEALTDGATREEALQEAADCLSEALAARIADGEAIPEPSPLRKRQYQVAPFPAIALKSALYDAMRSTDCSVAELSRRLKVDHREAQRLLDPRHPTKLPRMAEALAVFGRHVAVAVFDTPRPGQPIVSVDERQSAA